MARMNEKRATRCAAVETTKRFIAVVAFLFWPQDKTINWHEKLYAASKCPQIRRFINVVRLLANFHRRALPQAESHCAADIWLSITRRGSHASLPINEMQRAL